jgi:hypothetical protein
LTDLAHIHARCEEDGDCMVWKLYTSSAGVPKIGLTKDGKWVVVSARREVWKLTRKSPLGRKQLLTTKCGNPRCLNPEHLKLTKAAEVNAKNAQKADSKARRSLAMSEFNRKTKGKLDAQRAAEIRASEKRTSELVKEYGVCSSVIRRIRSGSGWRDSSTPNPWAGLGAR